MSTSETDFTESTFLVKILSGPHQGAEVELPPNEPILIGAGDDCDLVLSDALLADRHCQLVDQNGELQLSAMDGQVFVSGRLVRENPVTVTNFEFITIGTTQLVVGPAVGDWPPITLADAPELEEVSEEQVEETPSDEGKTRTGSAGEDGEEESEWEVIEEIPPAVELPPPPKMSDLLARQNARKIRQKRIRRVVLFVLFLVLSGATLIMLLPAKKRFSIDDYHRIVQARITDLEYVNDVIVSLENNQLIADGYVATNTELRDLRNQLLQIYPGLQFRVRSEERILSQMEETMNAIDSELRITTIQPGIYSVTGYVYNTENWQKIRNRLGRDIPGVKRVQEDILSPDKIQSMTDEVLKQQNLTNFIQVLPREDRIIFKGEIAMAQQEVWKKAAEEFIRLFNDTVPIEFDVQLSGVQTQQQGNRFFGSLIQGVTISSSGLGWVTLQNGQKYFEGSYLPSGYTIDEIGVDGIVFSRNNSQVRIRIEELQQ